MLEDSRRTEERDKSIIVDLTNVSLAHRAFLRLSAKSRRFSSVDFKYSYFDSCYLRSCVFDSCDFTGCRFIGSSFHGSKFVGCRFDYAVFERTVVDSDLLESNCPGAENLKMRFARTLRMNFQQLGDAASVNKAISVELEATREHLRKIWRSGESYYRAKYSGLKRLSGFLQWLKFEALNLFWGNGESLYKLLRSTGLILVLVALRDVLTYRDHQRVSSYVDALFDSPAIFLGVSTTPGDSTFYLAVVAMVRLIIIGLFLAILVRRLSRR